MIGTGIDKVRRIDKSRQVWRIIGELENDAEGKPAMTEEENT
jgi:hypothetical protein